MRSGSSGGRSGPLRTVGPYQLIAQLGQSPYGPTFVARLPGNEASFSLKLLTTELRPEEAARVRQELQTVTRLEHPGIVRPIDVGSEREQLYVVSEHVPGSTLQEQLSRSGPMGSREAALLVAELAAAVQVAHDAGVLHRGLRPGCVHLDARSGRPRLGDFGLGGLPRRGRAAQGAVAPELLAGEVADARVDVFGLGAILYEAITCQAPYDGGASGDGEARLLAGDLEPPRHLAPGVDPAIERICLRALARQPRRRQGSAAALERELRRVVVGRPGASAATLALVALVWLLSVAAPLAWAVRRGRELSELREREQASQGEVAAVRSELALSEASRRRGEEQLLSRQQQIEAARREAADLRKQMEQQLQQQAQNISGNLQRELELALLSGYDQGLLLMAQQQLLDALATVPGAGKVRLLLLRDLGRQSELVTQAEAMRAQGALEPFLEVVLADALAQLGRGEEARAAYGRVVAAPLAEDNPDRLWARLRLGSGDAAAQSALAQQLLKVADQRDYLLAWRAQNAVQAAQKQRSGELLRQALDDTRAALSMSPGCVDLIMLRGRVLQVALSARNEADPALLAELLGIHAAERLLTGNPDVLLEQAILLIQTGEAATLAHLLMRRCEAEAQQRQDKVLLVRLRIWQGNFALLVMNRPDEAGGLWEQAFRAGIAGTALELEVLPCLARAPAPVKRRVLGAISDPQHRARIERQLSEAGQ